MFRIKRNGHLVSSRVQRAVLMRFLMHWFFSAACFMTVVFSLHFFLGDPNARASSFFDELWSRYSLLCLVMFAVVPYLMYDLLKLTHRFAGPMVRFGDALHRAANGETVGPIKFRTGDYWQEMADDLNAVLSRLALAEAEKNTADCGEEANDVTQNAEPAELVLT